MTIVNGILYGFGRQFVSFRAIPQNVEHIISVCLTRAKQDKHRKKDNNSIHDIFIYKVLGAKIHLFFGSKRFFCQTNGKLSNKNKKYH